MATLFDAEEARDEAIARVEAHAPEGWVQRARDTVTLVAGTQFDFTTDEVWQELFGPVTHDHRAMGAVMRRAKTNKVCVPTGQYQTSTREVAHGRPVRVWRSLA
jgi:hypothetical protein